MQTSPADHPGNTSTGSHHHSGRDQRASAQTTVLFDQVQAALPAAKAMFDTVYGSPTEHDLSRPELAAWLLVQVRDEFLTRRPRSAEILAKMTLNLRDDTVRAAMTALDAGVYSAAAQRIWAQVASVTVGQDRDNADALSAGHRNTSDGLAAARMLGLDDQALGVSALQGLTAAMAARPCPGRHRPGGSTTDARYSSAGLEAAAIPAQTTFGPDLIP